MPATYTSVRDAMAFFQRERSNCRFRVEQHGADPVSEFEQGVSAAIMFIREHPDVPARTLVAGAAGAFFTEGARIS